MQRLFWLLTLLLRALGLVRTAQELRERPKSASRLFKPVIFPPLGPLDGRRRRFRADWPGR